MGTFDFQLGEVLRVTSYYAVYSPFHPPLRSRIPACPCPPPSLPPLSPPSPSSTACFNIEWTPIRRCFPSVSFHIPSYGTELHSACKQCKCLHTTQPAEDAIAATVSGIIKSTYCTLIRLHCHKLSCDREATRLSCCDVAAAYCNLSEAHYSQLHVTVLR